MTHGTPAGIGSVTVVTSLTASVDRWRGSGRRRWGGRRPHRRAAVHGISACRESLSTWTVGVWTHLTWRRRLHTGSWPSYRATTAATNSCFGILNFGKRIFWPTAKPDHRLHAITTNVFFVMLTNQNMRAINLLDDKIKKYLFGEKL